jgi:acetyl-CoA C-acetyltransferase
MADAVIVSTARTPIGKAFRGAFNDTHGADIGAHVISHAAQRAKLDLGEIEDVIMGCGTPEGATGMNIARQAAIRAGCPVSTSGVTVNRFCSSGLQTISMAAQRVLVDKVPVAIGAGLESISLTQGNTNRYRLVNDWIMEHKPGIYH